MLIKWTGLMAFESLFSSTFVSHAHSSIPYTATYTQTTHFSTIHYFHAYASCSRCIARMLSVCNALTMSFMFFSRKKLASFPLYHCKFMPWFQFHVPLRKFIHKSFRLIDIQPRKPQKTCSQWDQLFAYHSRSHIVYSFMWMFCSNIVSFIKFIWKWKW